MENQTVSPLVQKSNCRFQAANSQEGRPRLKLELFHQTVSCLKGATIEFEVVGGISAQQLRALAESINDKVIGIVVTQS